MMAATGVGSHARGRLRSDRTIVTHALAVGIVALAACGPVSGRITINNNDDLACTGERAPVLDLEGKLDGQPDAERVQLTYAVIVDGREGQFPGLLPIGILVTDPEALTVDFVDQRTRQALCQQVGFDTFTEDGQRSFVVRMLRERDRETLAEGRFSIMMSQ
jgi:hypothetical protein